MNAEAVENIAEQSRWMADMAEQFQAAMRKFISEAKSCHEGLKGFLAENMTGFVVGYDRAADGERRYIAAHRIGGVPNVTHTGTIETAQVWVSEKGVHEWIEDIRKSWGEDARGLPNPPPVEKLTECGCEELVVFKVRVVVTPHSKHRVAQGIARRG